jgi:hypothetical protein
MMTALWEAIESYRQEYPEIVEILRIFRLAEEEYQRSLELLYRYEPQPTTSINIGEYNVHVSGSAAEY